MRQLCSTATSTARATMHDSHAATISARNPVQSSRRVGTSGRGEVLARIQERHTWPIIKRDVVNHIKHCLTCQQTKHPAGNPFEPLQSLNSSNFNDLVQFDHLKLCYSESISRAGCKTGMSILIES